MKYFPLYLAAVLLLCLAPMPYGYFTLVRVMATVVFDIYAYRCFVVKKEGLTLVFATLDKTEHVPPLKTVKSVQFWS